MAVSAVSGFQVSLVLLKLEARDEATGMPVVRTTQLSEVGFRFLLPIEDLSFKATPSSYALIQLLCITRRKMKRRPH